MSPPSGWYCSCVGHGISMRSRSAIRAARSLAAGGKSVSGTREPVMHGHRVEPEQQCLGPARASRRPGCGPARGTAPAARTRAMSPRV